MKTGIIKLISVLILLCFSCENDKAKYKSTYFEAKTEKSVMELLDIYLATYEKLSKDEFGLKLVVWDVDDGFEINLDNFYLNQDGYNPEDNRIYSIVPFKGYRVYVLDTNSRISNRTNLKRNVVYPQTADSIIPTMYNGNPWVLIFKRGKLIEVKYAPETIKGKIFGVFNN